MITKEQFIEIIEDVKKQFKLDEDLGKAIEKMSGSWVNFNTENLIYASLFKLLKITFDDGADWIDWWLWEDVEKVVHYTDSQEEKDISDVGDFYDFLITIHEKK